MTSRTALSVLAVLPLLSGQTSSRAPSGFKAPPTMQERCRDQGIPASKCGTGFVAPPVKVPALGTRNRLSSRPARAGARPRLTTLPLTLAASAPRWRFANPDTSLVAGFRVRALLESPFFPMLMRQATSSLTSFTNPKAIDAWNQIAPLLSDVEELRISMNGTGQVPGVLVLVVGQFRDPKWTKILGKDAATVAATNAVLIGEPAAVNAAFQRLQGKGNSGPVVAKGRTLSDKHDIWIAADQSVFAHSAARQAMGSSFSLYSELRGLEVGLSLRDPLTADVMLATANRQVADQVLASMEALRVASESAPQRRQEWAQVTRNLKIEAADGGVRLHAAVTMEEITSAMAAARKAEEAKPKTIVIHGMEDGPKEVPTP